MRLPDFLIIGAMKAGTTSLYRDLLTNPQVFFPLDKEPNHLASDDVCRPEGRRRYSTLFDKAKAHQICGEASTAYTKLPDITGVPQRARQVLGDRLKVIYLVREPISRIISHHYHEWCSGAVGCGIDEAVRTYPRFINYSLYAMQITPWLQVLEPRRVRIVRFETYIKDRQGTVESLSRFLGIDSRFDTILPDAVYNKSEGKPVRRGPFGLLRGNFIYRSILRPMLSPPIRDKLRFALLPKAPPRPDLPSMETVRYIVDQVSDDIERLRVVVGQVTPLWDVQPGLSHLEMEPSGP